MKRRILSILIIIVLGVTASLAQTSQKKLNPVGNWKFEAPTAPEGYSSGVISVSIVEKKHAASISFTGSGYKIPGEKVKLTGDSLLFTVYLESETVKMFLRMTPDDKMSGKAVYSEGVVPLTLTKETQPK